jgi:hypothetical protein
MVTYVAIDSMGHAVDDTYYSVAPGTVSEALAVVRLQALLDDRDPVTIIRPPLALVRDGQLPASSAPF